MPPLERWRAAMEGYLSEIVRSRLEPLGARAVPFARYLQGMHGRVHPVFADRFLGSLDRRPKDDPLNAPHLEVVLEIAVAPDGRIARMGVVKPSGVPGFDASALEAFARAAPFEPTPEEIRSFDGNVWIRWHLHRDPVSGCSTIGAWPEIMGILIP